MKKAKDIAKLIIDDHEKTINWDEGDINVLRINIEKHIINSQIEAIKEMGSLVYGTFEPEIDNMRLSNIIKALEIDLIKTLITT